MSTYFSDVLRVGEVGQISIVQFLTFQIVTVISRPEITALDTIFLEKLPVSHSKSLTNSLGYNLSLGGEKES